MRTVLPPTGNWLSLVWVRHIGTRGRVSNRLATYDIRVLNERCWPGNEQWEKDLQGQRQSCKIVKGAHIVGTTEVGRLLDAMNSYCEEEAEKRVEATPADLSLGRKGSVPI